MLHALVAEELRTKHRLTPDDGKAVAQDSPTSRLLEGDVPSHAMHRVREEAACKPPCSKGVAHHKGMIMRIFSVVLLSILHPHPGRSSVQGRDPDAYPRALLAVQLVLHKCPRTCARSN